MLSSIRVVRAARFSSVGSRKSSSRARATSRWGRWQTLVFAIHWASSVSPRSFSPSLLLLIECSREAARVPLERDARWVADGARVGDAVPLDAGGKLAVRALLAMSAGWEKDCGAIRNPLQPRG